MIINYILRALLMDIDQGFYLFIIHKLQIKYLTHISNVSNAKHIVTILASNILTTSLAMEKVILTFTSIKSNFVKQCII